MRHSTQAADASAVPETVRGGMAQFVQTLTTPETELEQQIQEEVTRWLERHEQPPLASSVPAAMASGGYADRHCLAGSSLNNSRGGSPSWSGSDTAAGTGEAPSGPSSAPSTSSEEGASTAWRLCTHMQRSGWPVQHCASVRSGGGRAGGGWRANSGHEFLMLFPRAGRGPAGAQASDTSCSSSSGDAEMGDAAAALVIDPEFREQFLLPNPTARYQVVLSLLPRAFVGTYDRLQRLAGWACTEMQGSVQAGGSRLPPWRSLAHVLNKWRLHSEEEESGGDADSQQEQQEQQAMEAGSAAFSAEQQAAMQLLLQQPVAAEQVVPACGPQPLTASSSCSSMDLAPTSPAAGAGLAPAPAPRSLLTRKLAELAAAGPKRQHLEHWLPPSPTAQQPGPAAAILSLVSSSRGPGAAASAQQG